MVAEFFKVVFSEENLHNNTEKPQSVEMASVWLIVPILSLATTWMYFLTLIAPSVPSGKTNSTLKFPGNIEELQQVAQLIRLYYEVNWIYVLILYSSAYIYKQTFAIPGTNVLGGALFGVVVGFPLCCFLTAVGASCCYTLSATCGKEVVENYFPNQLKSFQEKVQKNSHQLLYYLLFLRMFPMSPNWLINVIAPLVGVPLPLFFFTVLFGLGPYVLVCTQAGVILSTLTSLDQLFSLKMASQMALLAVAALAPSFVFKKPQSVS
ncbi:Transmembrane protein 41A [Frankliniella fusca]|uniref:Transmembrane protein 41A n=1 Tax=Frankliniella fusca TaxID=407009 RepID=A0AAE1HMH8_9NEOP|nr:Transmembrane protein 41A [Frankliniella fusca]